MAVEISVLVPVYNVGKTLERCIQSILNQTFKDFEIILVDDGSTDQSGQICDYYADTFDNIRVIHKDNEGLGPTRNVAIKAAKGRYIYHCDSDDWIKVDLLDSAYRAIVDADADVAIFGYDMFIEKDSGMCHYGSVYCNSAVIVGKENVRKFFVNQYFNAFLVMSAWNRIYKRSFIMEQELFFPQLRRCQDMAYALLLFDHVEKLVTIAEPYYCYLIEPGVYKGRSYGEMLNIYCSIYEMTSDYFKKWNHYSDEIKQKLTNNLCEQIANYSVYAYAVKYNDCWRKNTAMLLEDKRLNELFSGYINTGSRFMRLFCCAYRLKSNVALLWVSYLTEWIKNKNKK